ncbi:hypothetical protein Q31a_53440 [Aureliella helgolandensis]|uniref:Uncharacterized protein n=1 Tax=Aureliella helgolandensis TaxID=2527968 RepID=A0A518GED4_9BACT|nr:hypothetical protein Q31a_53440 [Aureliella helgolandensis]
MPTSDRDLASAINRVQAGALVAGGRGPKDPATQRNLVEQLGHFTSMAEIPRKRNGHPHSQRQSKWLSSMGSTQMQTVPFQRSLYKTLA